MNDQIYPAVPATARVGVFHPGTQHSWQTAHALELGGHLAWYATSIFYDPGRFPYSVLKSVPPPLRNVLEREFRRFEYQALSPDLVHTFGAAEWAMRMAQRIGMRTLARWLHRYDNSAFAAPVSRLTKALPVDALWGYDLSSLEVFERFKSSDTRLILDRTIGHPAIYNKIMSDLREQHREFFLDDFDELVSLENIDRANREHELADVILCGSEFCADTVRAAGTESDAAKLKIVEYCYDGSLFQSGVRAPRAKDEPLEFLFLGQAGPRKGIHLILEAFRRIPKSAANLTIVGALKVPGPTFERYADRLTYRPTVPRSEVPALMGSADCLLLPSYFEGSAITTYEAAAMGLPVIQSLNTGTAHLGGIGPVLEKLTVDDLIEAVMSIVDNRLSLKTYAENATSIAASLTFEGYIKRANGVISDV